MQRSFDGSEGSRSWRSAFEGKTPTIDLVLGYKKSNKSPVLKLLLSRLDELIARASSEEHGVDSRESTT